MTFCGKRETIHFENFFFPIIVFFGSHRSKSLVRAFNFISGITSWYFHIFPILVLMLSCQRQSGPFRPPEPPAAGCTNKYQISIVFHAMRIPDRVYVTRICSDHRHTYTVHYVTFYRQGRPHLFEKRRLCDRT